MNPIATTLIVLIGLVIATFNVWLFVVGVQFLRTGTRAFRRYLAATAAPVSSAPLLWPAR